MAPLIDDLKQLEKGVKIDDKEEIHGCLTAFKADNQASHRVGAFKRGFTAEHCCRYCMMPFCMIQVATREIESYLRTVEQYNEQVEKLNACSTKEQFKELSQAFGLNGESPLNDLEFAHAINVLPPDFFHDIIEHGSLDRTLHFILIRFLTGETKVMTLNQFNSRVSEFDFGYSETKPSKIKVGHLDKSNKLHQTGAQLWSLALITPLILGPLVDVDDEYWINYILILEITSIIAGYEVSMETLGFIEFEIDSYLETFQKLYKVTLTPKQHFLIHYIRLILLYGPLYQYNTLRQEAKHQFFKQAIKKIRNLKNPSMTLAQHHQIYLLSCSEEFQEDIKDIGEVEMISKNKLPFSHLLPPDVEEISTVTWIKNDGVTYVAGKCFVMIDYKNHMPEFGLLSTIVYANGETKLMCRKVLTLHFDFHLNAYCIQVTKEYQATDLDHLRAPTVYHAHYVEGDHYIIVKRAVGDLY
ncbi:hypothetical protein QAD02_018383 [Eretmocerus hayati]|uniref:Uncharacterized protein n=1 Tax=Eretmocerus hayati TaxID=131215 RepID=A0ACC2PHU9_9HYME|nr:hypothetical protein QAD02_018383 [Eretmocerus hayati]